VLRKRGQGCHLEKGKENRRGVKEREGGEKQAACSTGEKALQKNETLKQKEKKGDAHYQPEKPHP